MALLSIRRVRKDLVPRLIEAPETGMGFQRISINNIPHSFLTQNLENLLTRIIVNGEFVFDYDNLIFVPLLFNMDGFLNDNVEPFVFERLSLVLSSKYEDTPISGALPPYTYYSKPGDVFIRLSAFDNDRRILLDGSVREGTYATTLTDMKVTPSGAAAVGRYALPDRLPAVYVYRIIPPPKTPVFFGTVTPNYGLCGGGVEVYFPQGCPAGSANLYETIPDK
jgi:hypothetical protein